MRKITTLLVLTALAVVTLWASEDKAEIGEEAPNFTLEDYNGAEFSLEEFKGNYVVLEWINFDCPFVKKHYETKNMQELQKEYTKKGVVWLTICSSAEGKQGFFRSNEIAKRMRDYEAAPTAYLIDESGEVGKKYGAKTTPNMYVINPEGELIYMGAIDNRATTDKDDVEGAENYVKECLDASLSGNSFKTKTTKPYGCSVKYASK